MRIHESKRDKVSMQEALRQHHLTNKRKFIILPWRAWMLPFTKRLMKIGVYHA